MSDRFEEMIKLNRNASMKYGLSKGLWFFIKVFALYLIIYILFLFIIPTKNISNIMGNKNLILLIILLITIFQVVLRYKWMKRRLDVVSVIRDIKREETFPLISIRENMIRCKCLLDISEKKLEFVKTFSTIPFLSYAVGIYVNTGKNINDILYTNIIELSLKEIVFYLALLLTIIYISVFIVIFKEYKDNKDDLLEYASAEIRIMGEKGGE